MFKLPRNRLWVGKTNQGTPCAFQLEHVVSLIQNPYAAHIVWVKLDSGESLIVDHHRGLVGVLEGFDISVAESFFGPRYGMPADPEPEKAAA